MPQDFLRKNLSDQLPKQLKKRQAKKRRQQKRRRSILEQLESRQLLAADAAGEFADHALHVPLGIDQLVEVNAEIGDGDEGDQDVDFFRIDLDAGQPVKVDVDAEHFDDAASTSTLNSYLRIFDSAGLPIASNGSGLSVHDHSNLHQAQSQGTTILDSYLEFTAGQSGSYYIGVSSEANNAYDPLIEGARVSGSTGEYRLQLSTTEAPESWVSVEDVQVPFNASTARVKLTLSSQRADEVSVLVTTQSLTADSGVDFTSVSQVVTFEEFSSEAFLDIPLLQANETGETKFFEVVLSDPVDVSLDRSAALVSLAPQDGSGNAANPYELLTYFSFDTSISQTHLLSDFGDDLGGLYGALSGAGAGRTGLPDDQSLRSTNGSLKVTDPDFFDEIEQSDSLTVSFWQNLDALASAMSFIAYSPTAGYNRGLSAHTPWPNGQAYFDTAGCCWSDQRVTGPMPAVTLGDWHHFALIKDGEHKRLYMDGELFLAGSGQKPLPFDLQDLYIGGFGVYYRTQGRIDDFAIYSEPLPDFAIAALADGAFPDEFDLPHFTASDITAPEGTPDYVHQDTVYFGSASAGEEHSKTLRFTNNAQTSFEITSAIADGGFQIDPASVPQSPIESGESFELVVSAGSAAAVLDGQLQLFVAGHDHAVFEVALQATVLEAGYSRQVIDDGDARFSIDSGQWTQSSQHDQLYREGHIHYSTSDDPVGTVSWTFDTQPGVYDASTSFYGRDYHSNQVPIRIVDVESGLVLLETDIDQRESPIALPGEDYGWLDIGEFEAVGASTRVELLNDGGPNRFIADSMALHRKPSIDVGIVQSDAVIPFSHEKITFGSYAASDLPSKTVRLTNTSDETLTVESLQLTGGFLLQTAVQIDDRIVPGQSVDLNITPSTAAGVYTGELNLSLRDSRGLSGLAYPVFAATIAPGQTSQITDDSDSRFVLSDGTWIQETNQSDGYNQTRVLSDQSGTNGAHAGTAVYYFDTSPGPYSIATAFHGESTFASSTTIRIVDDASGTVLAQPMLVQQSTPSPLIDGTTLGWEDLGDITAIGNLTRVEVLKQAYGNQVVADAVRLIRDTTYDTYRNTTPIAIDDRYVIQDESLPFTVDAASGLLSNDLDEDGHTIRTAISRLPEYGTVTLESDGSFTYIASNDFTGIDQFYYTTFDGVATMEASVTLVTEAWQTANLGTVNPSPTGPKVQDVFLSSSTWNQTLLDGLPNNEPGFDTTLGQSLKIDAARQSLPWQSADTIRVQFSEDIGESFREDNIRIIGSTGTVYSDGATFEYGVDGANMGTISLAVPIVNDTVRLTIYDLVTNQDGLRLDGEGGLTETGSPGDDTPGGEFVTEFSMVPGDLTRDGFVTADDWLALYSLISAEDRPVADVEEFFRDPDGDGVLEFDDDGSWIFQQLGVQTLPFPPTELTPWTPRGNTAPATSDSLLTMDQHSDYVFAVGDFPFVDADGDQLRAVQVIEVPGNGRLTIAEDAVTIGQIITQSQIAGGQLRYEADPTLTTTDNDSILFRVADNTTFSTAQTLNLETTVSNAAPTIVPFGKNISVDGQATFSVSDFSYSDLESTPLSHVILETEPKRGQLQWVGGGLITEDTVINSNQIPDVRYIPPAGEYGRNFDVFQFRASDGTATSLAVSVTIDIDATSVAPLAMPQDIYLASDKQQYVLQPTDFWNTDSPGNEPTSLIISQLPAAADGTLVESGTAVTVGQTIPWSSLVAGSLAFQGAASQSTTSSFQYKLENAHGQSADATTTVHKLSLPSDHTFRLTLESEAVVEVLQGVIEDAKRLGPETNRIELDFQSPSPEVMLWDALEIDTNVEIVGIGAPVVFRIDAVAPGQSPYFDVSRLVNVHAGATVKLQNLHLTAGELNEGDGGAIHNLGTLELERVRISDSKSHQGRGGAIYNEGTLTLTDTTLDSNEAHLSGGAIANLGALTLVRSTLHDNVAGTTGGAIHQENGGTSTLISSTISGNEAWQGGAIYNLTGDVHASTTTIAKNQALQPGSGIYNQGTLTLENTLVGDNGANSDIVSSTGLNDLGHNLIGSIEGLPHFDPPQSNRFGFGNSWELDPRIAKLRDNGGHTWTHALLPGSPAIDAGVVDNSVLTDQRGVDRIQDGAGLVEDAIHTATPDIGSYEMATFVVNYAADAPDLTPLGDGRVDVDPHTEGDQVSLRGAIQELNAIAGHFGDAENTVGVVDWTTDFVAKIDFAPNLGELVLNLVGAQEDDAATGDLDLYGNYQFANSSGSVVNVTGKWDHVHGDQPEDTVPDILSPGGILRDRIFQVHPGSNVVVDGLTVSGGHAIEADLQKNPSSGLGGAFHVVDAELTLINTEVNSNFADVYGGGIYSRNSTINLEGSTITRGYAYGGGAIASIDSTITLDESKLIDSRAYVGGGAMMIVGGNYSITNNSEITNSAITGPGQFADLTVDIASREGRGLYQTELTPRLVEPVGDGAAIFAADEASGIISNTTIFADLNVISDVSSGSSGNNDPSSEDDFVVGTHGGAIFNQGHLTIIDSTLEGHAARIGGLIYNLGELDVDGTDLLSGYAGSAGAIYNGATATTRIADSLLSDNQVPNIDDSLPLGMAIVNNNGTVDLIRSTVINNQGYTGTVGSIYNFDVQARLNIIDSRIESHSSSHDLTAVVNLFGSLTVDGSSFVSQDAQVNNLAADDQWIEYSASAILSRTEARPIARWWHLPPEAAGRDDRLGVHDIRLFERFSFPIQIAVRPDRDTTAAGGVVEDEGRNLTRLAVEYMNVTGIDQTTGTLIVERDIYGTGRLDLYQPNGQAHDVDIAAQDIEAHFNSGTSSRMSVSVLPGSFQVTNSTFTENQHGNSSRGNNPTTLNQSSTVVTVTGFDTSPAVFENNTFLNNTAVSATNAIWSKQSHYSDLPIGIFALTKITANGDDYLVPDPDERIRLDGQTWQPLNGPGQPLNIYNQWIGIGSSSTQVDPMGTSGTPDTVGDDRHPVLAGTVYSLLANESDEADPLTNEGSIIQNTIFGTHEAGTGPDYQGQVLADRLNDQFISGNFIESSLYRDAGTNEFRQKVLVDVGLAQKSVSTVDSNLVVALPESSSPVRNLGNSLAFTGATAVIQEELSAEYGTNWVQLDDANELFEEMWLQHQGSIQNFPRGASSIRFFNNATPAFIGSEKVHVIAYDLFEKRVLLRRGVDQTTPQQHPLDSYLHMGFAGRQTALNVEATLETNTLVVPTFDGMPSSVPFDIKIGREILSVTGVTTRPDGLMDWAVDRATKNSVARRHLVGSPVLILVDQNDQSVLEDFNSDGVADLDSGSIQSDATSVNPSVVATIDSTSEAIQPDADRDITVTLELTESTGQPFYVDLGVVGGSASSDHDFDPSDSFTSIRFDGNQDEVHEHFISVVDDEHIEGLEQLFVSVLRVRAAEIGLYSSAYLESLGVDQLPVEDQLDRITADLASTVRLPKRFLIADIADDDQNQQVNLSVSELGIAGDYLFATFSLDYMINKPLQFDFEITLPDGSVPSYIDAVHQNQRITIPPRTTQYVWQIPLQDGHPLVVDADLRLTMSDLDADSWEANVLVSPPQLVNVVQSPYTGSGGDSTGGGGGGGGGGTGGGGSNSEQGPDSQGEGSSGGDGTQDGGYDDTCPAIHDVVDEPVTGVYYPYDGIPDTPVYGDPMVVVIQEEIQGCGPIGQYDPGDTNREPEVVPDSEPDVYPDSLPRRMPNTHGDVLPARPFVRRDYEVSHRSSLTFNPIATYDWDPQNSDAPVPGSDANDANNGIPYLTIRRSNGSLVQVGSSLPMPYGTLTVNDDFTLTYDPAENLVTRDGKNANEPILVPEMDGSGTIVRFAGIEPIKAVVAVMDANGDETILAERDLELVVSNRMPVFIGDRIHQSDIGPYNEARDHASGGTAQFELDSPIVVDFETNMQLDINDLFFDPDGDAISINRVMRGESFEVKGVVAQRIFAVQTDVANADPDFVFDPANPLGDYEPLNLYYAKTGSSTFEFFNEVSRGDATQAENSAASFNMLAVSFQFHITDGQQYPVTSVENEIFVAELALDVQPRDRTFNSAYDIGLELDKPVTEHSSHAEIVSPPLLFRVGLPVDNKNTAGDDLTTRFDAMGVTSAPPWPAELTANGWNLSAEGASPYDAVETIGDVSVDLNTGQATLLHPLNLDRSGGAADLSVAGLVYDPSTVWTEDDTGKNVNSHIITAQLEVPNLDGLPSTAQISVDWFDGITGAFGEYESTTVNRTLNLENAKGKTLSFAVPIPGTPRQTSLYHWQLKVSIPNGGTGGPLELTANGQSALVVNQSAEVSDFHDNSFSRQNRTSIFGDGWDLAGVPTLTTVRYEDRETLANFDDRWEESRDNRFMISFPGSAPMLFDASVLVNQEGTISQDGVILPSASLDSFSSVHGNIKDDAQYGSLLARQLPVDAHDKHKVEPTVGHKPDELVYTAPDGVTYVFQRFRISATQTPSGSDKVDQYLLTRVQPAGVEAPVRNESRSESDKGRHAMYFLREKTPTESDYGQLVYIASSDGNFTAFEYDAGGRVTALLIADDKSLLVDDDDELLSGTDLQPQRTVRFTYTGEKLTQIKEENSAPEDLTDAEVYDRQREFTYTGNHLQKDLWKMLDGASAPDRVTEFVLDPAGASETSISGAYRARQIIFGTANTNGSATFDFTPAFAERLEGVSTGDALVASLHSELDEHSDAGMRSAAGGDSIAGTNVTEWTLGADGYVQSMSRSFDQSGQSTKLSETTYTRNSVGDVTKVETKIERQNDSSSQSGSQVEHIETVHYDYDYDIPIFYATPSEPYHILDSDPTDATDDPHQYDHDDFRGNVLQIVTRDTTTDLLYETDDELGAAVGLLVERKVTAEVSDQRLSTYQYDVYGRLLQSVDHRENGNRVESFEYHVTNPQSSKEDGLLKSHVDARGLTTTYEEYSFGRPQTVLVVDKGVATGSTSIENLSKFGKGDSSKHREDLEDALLEIQTKTKYEYDSFGYLDTATVSSNDIQVSITDLDTDALGHVIRTRTVNHEDQVISDQIIEYNSAGQPTFTRTFKEAEYYDHTPTETWGDATDRDFIASFYDYSLGGLLTQQTEASGSTFASAINSTAPAEAIEQVTAYEYYSDGTLMTTTLPSGDQIGFLFNPIDRVDGEGTAPGSSTWTITTNVRVDNADTHQAIREDLDVFGRIVATENTLTGSATHYAYPDNYTATPDEVSTRVNLGEGSGGTGPGEDNVIDKLTYDKLGQLTSSYRDKNPGDSLEQLATATTTYEYDQLGYLVSETVTPTDASKPAQTGSGSTVSSNIDNAYFHAAPVTTTYHTNPAGDVAKIEHERRTFDLQASLQSSGSDHGWTTETLISAALHDQSGRQRASADPELKNEASAEIPRTKIKYENGLLVTESWDRNKDTTKVVVDALGRAIESTNALGGLTSFTYDVAGRMTESLLTDPRAASFATLPTFVDRKVTYEYDDLGRARKTTYGEGNEAYFTAVDHVVTRGQWNVTSLPATAVSESGDLTARTARIKQDSTGFVYESENPDPGSVTRTVTSGASTDHARQTTKIKVSYDTSELTRTTTQETQNVKTASGDSVTRWERAVDNLLGQSLEIFLPIESTVAGEPTFDNTTRSLFSHTPSGKRSESKDQFGNTTEHTRFDPITGNAIRSVRRDASQDDDEGQTTYIIYDSDGSVVLSTPEPDHRIENAPLNVHQYTIDGIGRVVEDKHWATSADNSDPLTNPTKDSVVFNAHYSLSTDRAQDGVIVDSNHQDRKRTKTYQLNDEEITQTFDLNVAGEIIRAREGGKVGSSAPESVLKALYDSAGRVKQETRTADKHGFNVPRSDIFRKYDLAGQRLSADFHINTTSDDQPGALVLRQDKHIDQLGRTVRLVTNYASVGAPVWANASVGPDHFSEAVYNGDGTFRTVTHYQGTIDGSTQDRGHSTFAYDAEGRLTNLDHFQGPGRDPIIQHEMEFEANERPTSVVATAYPDGSAGVLDRRETNFDSAGRLQGTAYSQGGAALPTPDADATQSGHRSRASGTLLTDNEGRVIEDNYYVYKYDKDGRLTKRRTKAIGRWASVDWSDYKNKKLYIDMAPGEYEFWIRWAPLTGTNIGTAEFLFGSHDSFDRTSATIDFGDRTDLVADDLGRLWRKVGTFREDNSWHFQVRMTPNGDGDIQLDGYKVVPSSAQLQYDYDPLGRLVKTTETEAASGHQFDLEDPFPTFTNHEKTETEYRYNALNQKVSKVVTRHAYSVAPQTLEQTGYIYDGKRLIFETDGSGKITRGHGSQLGGVHTVDMANPGTTTRTIRTYTDIDGASRTIAEVTPGDVNSVHGDWSIVHRTFDVDGLLKITDDQFSGDVDNIWLIQNAPVTWKGLLQDDATGLYMTSTGTAYDAISAMSLTPQSGVANYSPFETLTTLKTTDQAPGGVGNALINFVSAIVGWFRDGERRLERATAEFVQSQVDYVAETPQRFVDYGDRIGRFAGQSQRRDLITRQAQLELQVLDQSISDGTFSGDASAARNGILEKESREISESFQYQFDAIAAAGGLALETAEIAAPLAGKLAFRVAGSTNRNLSALGRRVGVRTPSLPTAMRQIDGFVDIRDVGIIRRAPQGGFGVNGQIGALPEGADSAVLRELYLDQVNSTTFGVKLGIHNTIKKATTFGRSKWVTRSDVESVLRNNTQFRVGASTVHKVDNGFIVGGRESSGYFNRATSHHEMMHIGQYIRNPNIIDTRPFGYIHEVIPSYVGTPELYGSGTIIIGGGAYLINDALSN